MKYMVIPCDFDYNTYKKIIEDLIKEYPFLNVQLIGRTTLGRSIFALTVGNNKNNGIYVGSVDGSDSFSALILLLFIERLCYSIKSNHPLCSVNVRKALALSGVTVIPCLNPDGREIFVYGPKSAGRMESFVSSLYDRKSYQWNANAMGVDINLNFSSQGQQNLLQSESFSSKGDYPESEAETKALTRLCRMKPFKKCLEIFEGENEIFYKSKESEPVSSSMEAKILACSCSMPINSGYSSHYGIMDWFIKEFRRSAFSLGADVNKENFYSAYEKIEEALTVFALM